ncbi:hypothetical protein FocTR4_00005405 [Fusarium oxysporum f. sp. cubense]|uniref:Uncharacterized protein n=1 Tax=Fusarium oxysporum f. sp. cubense TaxID=61366 RepID=A0A5C6TED2_FUSOC|nr:hypothetical protein FocTR4_00005405 [Fusarium oxysporum f. sp. cubense]
MEPIRGERGDPTPTLRTLGSRFSKKKTHKSSPRVSIRYSRRLNSRRHYHGKKTIVVSEFVLFLDIIIEGIRRQAKTEDVFNFALTEDNVTLQWTYQREQRSNSRLTKSRED